MLVIWFIAIFIFGCERSRRGERDERRAEDREAVSNERNNLISVTRDGVME